MASDLKLTAAGILAHVLETCGIRTGTTIDRKDLENMAASLDDQLSALIAAAKRVEAAERQKRIACGVADKLGERLRASNARATAAEARVGELTKALEFYADRKSYDGTKNLIDGGWGGSSLEAHSDVIADRGQRARTALKPQGEEKPNVGPLLDIITRLRTALATMTAERDRMKLACIKMDDEIGQTLGKALGYPWYKDDQVNFPGATEANGVCVGEHVAATIAMEAAAALAASQKTVKVLGEECRATRLERERFFDKSSHAEWAESVRLAGDAIMATNADPDARRAVEETP